MIGDPSPTTGCSSRHCLCRHSAIIRCSILILNPDGELEGRAGPARAGGWLGILLEGPFGIGLHPACPPSPAAGPSRHVYTWLRSARSTPSHCGRLLWEGLEHFHSLSTFLSAPGRPGLHRNYKLDTACLWSLQRGHALSCLEVLMPLTRPPVSTKGKGPT